MNRLLPALLLAAGAPALAAVDDAVLRQCRAVFLDIDGANRSPRVQRVQ